MTFLFYPLVLLIFGGAIFYCFKRRWRTAGCVLALVGAAFLIFGSPLRFQEDSLQGVEKESADSRHSELPPREDGIESRNFEERLREQEERNAESMKETRDEILCEGDDPPDSCPDDGV